MQHQGVSLSTGNPMSAAMSAAGSLAGANHSDSAASTTYAAVSDGNIIIRDTAHQKQSVSELSRDTDHAANGLSPIFNKQNELKRLQTVQLLGDIGSQVSDIALTEGKIRAAQQAKQQTENASATERRQVRNKLTAEANARAAKTGTPAAAVSEAAVTQKIYSEHYNQALTESGFGTGGKYQQAITAATAAIQGLITNSPGAALSGAAAPYLATEIKRLTTDKNEHQNKPAALLAHAIVNAALAAASGEGKQGAIAAAAGAVTGEATAIIAVQGFGKDPSQLSEEEKQTISTLATLASGLAGALLTDSGTGALTAAQAGKTTAENNYLSTHQRVQRKTELSECKSLFCKVQTEVKWTAIDLGQNGSFATGMVAGVPASLYDTVHDLVKMGLSPVETYESFKTLFSSGNILGNVTDAVKQSYIDRINRLESEYERAGAGGSFNAGVETGKLVTDIVTLAAGSVGVVKGGAQLAGNVVAKIIKTAESKVAATGEKAAVAAGRVLKNKALNNLENIKKGIYFNKAQSPKYPFNELYIKKADGSCCYRLDSYNPKAGEIVSRKFTQLSDISQKTAKSYISEAVKKYPRDAIIADVPSSGSLAGHPLRGKNILEVPPQKKPIPQSILDAANKAGVTIRDTNRRIYNE